MAEEKSMTYISAEDVSVGYHDLPLIEKIHFHVDRGEILTLIGPNGAGKSTILKSIIGQADKRGSVAGWNHYGSHEGKRHSCPYVCNDDRTGKNRTHDLRRSGEHGSLPLYRENAHPYRKGLAGGA